MADSPESNFSVTCKTERSSLVTVRGDDADHFKLNIRAAVIAEIGDEVRMLEEAVLGGSSAPRPNPASAIEKPAEPEAQALEVVDGKYDGQRFTYGHPDAPVLEDGRGRYILKEWTSKAGKKLRAWVDPMEGPKKAKPAAEKAELIWAD